MINKPRRQQQISDELDIIYKQMADLHDKVKELKEKGHSPLSPEMQKAKAYFEELQRKKILLFKETNYSYIIPENPQYDAGLE
jgi:FtsZ-binding cell division protein ZapB